MGKLKSQMGASLGRKYGYEGEAGQGLLQQSLSGPKAHALTHSPTATSAHGASALRCPQILQAPGLPCLHHPTVPHG